jgi:hypothetical protein
MGGMADMNTRIRIEAGRSPVLPAPSAEPEPQPQPLDYGAGPRQPAIGAGADGMNRWLRDRYGRSPQEAVTVERPKP